MSIYCALSLCYCVMFVIVIEYDLVLVVTTEEHHEGIVFTLLF
jgi:hypothetical protein